MEQVYELRQFCELVEPSPRTTHVYTTERDWDGAGLEHDESGLDNDGLDISQLDSYINDANCDAMYFGDLSNVDELKGLGGIGTQKEAPARHGQHQLVHHMRTGSHPPHPNHLVQTTSPNHPHPNHQLPDSPPDSASEPYSPDHPNFSPNHRVLTELYSSSHHLNGHKLLNIGGFNPPQDPIHPPHPPIHPPHPPLHPQQHRALRPPTNPQGQLQPHVPNGIHYPHYQPTINVTHLSSNVSMTTIPSYGPNPGPPQESDKAPAAISEGGKKRKMTENTQSGSSVKEEPEQNMLNPSPKRQSLPPSLRNGTGGSPPVVPGPAGEGLCNYPGEEDDILLSSSNGEDLDPSFQCIRFQSFQQQSWGAICDSSLKELNIITFRVDADKGFNFSHPDDAFVCQKKNHFQVTNHIQVSGQPYYIKTPEGRLQKVDKFYVHFFGVKTESPSQTIRVEQSQSDRSKKAFHPVPVDLKPDLVTKVTVGRLHFSETTSNNMRKKGKPNPDQRFFFLVVSLQAHCGDEIYPVVSHCSEKIIVRASNPGQFESDVEYTFQRGSYPESIFHMGKVGINTDRPDEALVIHGNLKITGHFFQPSDLRAKENIEEIDTKEQLKNVQSLRVVKYAYKENFLQQTGLEGNEVYDTGMIAQEVKEVIPDAVRVTGDVTLANGEIIDNFLLLNKERIFMENVGAVKELCKVTGNLENRIGELERMNSKIAKLKRLDSFKSSISSTSTVASSVISRLSSLDRNRKGCGSRRHQDRRRSGGEGVCSNSLLQISTISVVCVMALCLMALATIYILDYQNRREPRFPAPSVTTASSNGLNYSIITGSWNPTTLFPVNLSSNNLISSMGLFPTSFTTLSPSTAANSLTSVTFTIPSSTRMNQATKPPVLGSPEGCFFPSDGSTPSCPVFCCKFPDTYNERRNWLQPTRHSSITVTRRYRLQGRSSEAPNTYENDLITNKVSTNDPYLQDRNHSYTPDDLRRRKSLPSKKSDSSFLSFLRLTDGKVMSDPDSQRRGAKKQMRTERSTNEDFKTENPVRVPIIEISELDDFVNQSYCLNSTREYLSECLNGTASNFTYVIPISPFMSFENLTITFKFDSAVDAARQFFVCAACDGEPDPRRLCADDTVATSDCRATAGGVEGNTYRVTLIEVGRWERISYRFRLKTFASDETALRSPQLSSMYSTQPPTSTPAESHQRSSSL